MRFLTYSHDSYGLGHLKRTFMISQFVAERFKDAMALSLIGLPFGQVYFDPRLTNHDFIKLPSIQKTGPGTYGPRHLPMEWQEMTRLRQGLLTEVMRHFRPDLVMVDKTPRGVGDELVEGLEVLKKQYHSSQIVLGIRDILDEPGVVKREWHNPVLIEWILRTYDAIWIWGEESVFDTVREYDFPRPIQRLCKYMGYLPPDPRAADAEKLRAKAGVESGQKFLLISAGGGGDALPIYLPIIKGIQRAAQPNVKVLIVAGPLMSEEAFYDLRLAIKPLKDQVHVSRFLSQFVDWMRAADATISMGGYNTLREGAALGKPLLVIPRTYPRLEQQIRAQNFTSRGWCYTLKPDQSIEEATEHFVRQLADNELHYSVTTLPCRGFTNLFHEVKILMEELQQTPAIDAPF